MIHIVEPSVQIVYHDDGDETLKKIERIGRICYQSQKNISEDSAERFVDARLHHDHHDSLLEHCSFTAIFICDRGVHNEIVRHRLASYAAMSTRYCRLDNEHHTLAFIEPPFATHEGFQLWKQECEQIQTTYLAMLEAGEKPEIARAILPLSLAMEMAMTANLREWRHFLKLRTAENAHPQIRQLANQLLKQCKEIYPVIFDDIEPTTGTYRAKIKTTNKLFNTYYMSDSPARRWNDIEF